MTLQEKISRLNAIQDEISDGGIEGLKRYNAMTSAINALMKQIAVRPIYSDYKEDDDGENIIPYSAQCPNCGNKFEFGYWNDDDNHHCKCGQRIDWSDME